MVPSFIECMYVYTRKYCEKNTILYIGPKVVEVEEAYINEWNVIFIDMKDYDTDDEKLVVKITSPSEEKNEVQFEVEYSDPDSSTNSTDHNRATIKYFPTETGKHKITIKWRGSDIRKSPCTVLVQERPSKPLHKLHCRL